MQYLVVTLYPFIWKSFVLGRRRNAGSRLALLGTLSLGIIPGFENAVRQSITMTNNTSSTDSQKISVPMSHAIRARNKTAHKSQQVSVSLQIKEPTGTAVAGVHPLGSESGAKVQYNALLIKLVHSKNGGNKHNFQFLMLLGLLLNSRSITLLGSSRSNPQLRISPKCNFTVSSKSLLRWRMQACGHYAHLMESEPKRM